MITNTQIETALNCVTKLAMGLDPVSGEDAREDSVLNSPEIIRTMFTVKAVLEQTLYAPKTPEATTEKTKVKKSARPRDTRKVGFPPEIAENFTFKRNTTVTHFIKDMYECTDNTEFKPVKASQIHDWLMLEGILEAAYDQELDVAYKAVTKKGEELGFSNRRVESGLGGRRYISVIFDEKAQHFLVKNMARIINGESSEE